MARSRGICSVDGCGEPHLAKGWCQAHYHRMRNYGDLNARGPQRGLSDLQRFIIKVEQVGDCWEWTAAKDWYNYGLFTVEGSNVRAARFSYETFIGPIPEGLEIDHLCRNAPCVRPSHLEPVTHHENVLRRVAVLERITHCKRGHEFTEDNTRWTPRPYGLQRRCRECSRLHSYKRWKRIQNEAKRGTL